MLRILISALQVGPGQTGVGVFTLELIRAMSRIARQEEIVVGAPFPDSFDFLEGLDGFRVEPIRLWRDDPWGRMLATHTAIPVLARRLGVDVVFGPNYIAPLWGRFARVVAVHDLTFVQFPETTSRLKRIYYRIVVPHSIRVARRIHVDTGVIAREVVELEPTARNKLELVPLGVSPTYLENGGRDEESALTTRSRHGFLFVGTLEPRKNLARLLAAHGSRCRADSGFPPLRLVGGKGWEDEGIYRALAEHPDPHRVELLGYCSIAELRSHYDSALALLFPSLYEGFGLPILEAMARGCPVLTSRGIATEEVAGGAALLVDPLDQGDMERALQRLAADAELRRRLGAAGRLRAQEFSWERCAEDTLESLRNVALSRNR